MRDEIKPAAVELLSDARRLLLEALKASRWATIPELAQGLSISTEAVRQQLSYLRRQGWVESDCDPAEDDERVPGRPPVAYCLSPAAEDLFPKAYASLAVTLFDELAHPDRTMALLTDRRVQNLTAADDGVEALRSIYRDGDPFARIETADRGFSLIELNCPYLQFATERPLFCSTTVSALRRLTKSEVVREERFQDGDGRCVFHIYKDVPLSRNRAQRRFEAEPPRDWRPR